MARLVFTILGCGSSGGVPRLGGHWGACDPDEPRNRRRRCSLLIEREDAGGTTRILVDTSPDMRAQLLDAGVGTLDAVVYTHEHADHVHGLDDLRMIVFNTRQRLPVWADASCRQALLDRFGYAFETPEGSPYPPILDLNLIAGPLRIDGAGGEVEVTPFTVNHGSIDALGLRIADFAYLPDVAEMNDAAWAAIEGLDCWVVDALRYKPHPTHSHVGQTLDWIARAAPRRAVLTNMHIDIDYATIAADTPDHIIPAHDGLRIEYDL
ncbi:MBL fold metallo-hydrolase [Roseobacter sp. HKCCA0434]|uniref:MBL fold metallo-hydrolase n=1 Tax=Roseobacter sp. HKCCA0434 TaxID=3079297 RepID=UPI002905A637|nr:MBL fold metallo-hydrolase [Roseobacter sp. HKCCA0434]